MHALDPEILESVGIFSTLAPTQRARLAASGEVTDHAEADLLAVEGAIGQRFHLLLAGAAMVERDGAEVARIGAGDFVGEIGLLGGGRATATVRCSTPTRCLTLRRERFWSVLEDEPAIALRILEVVCRRLEGELQPRPVGQSGPG